MRTIVEDLPYFDMIKDIPLDPMHLFDIGVMRRILTFLFGTRKGRNIRGVTLPNQTISLIDAFIVSVRKLISRIDFARQPSVKHEKKFYSRFVTCLLARLHIIYNTWWASFEPHRVWAELDRF